MNLGFSCKRNYSNHNFQSYVHYDNIWEMAPGGTDSRECPTNYRTDDVNTRAPRAPTDSLRTRRQFIILVKLNQRSPNFFVSYFYEIH